MAKNKDDKNGRDKLYKRLRNHYKLVILNIDTFEERFSFLLTPLNVIVLSGVTFLLISISAFALLGWTPLRYYLPDYAEEVRVRKLAIETALKADSMELELSQRDEYINNIRLLVEGRVDTSAYDASALIEVDPLEIEYTRSPEDSLLRKEIEREDLLNLNPSFNRDSKTAYLLFPPIKGTVMDRFNVQRNHFGVDVAAPKDASIKAVDDGTVIIASYTAETGYILQVQHDNDLISVYKHNSSLLKKEGDKVPNLLVLILKLICNPINHI